MDNVKISGIKRIAINDDPNNIIEFNPGDVLFMERLMAVYQAFLEKGKEFEQLQKSSENEADNEEIFANIAQNIEYIKETCIFIREKIDMLFGEGTSTKAFGDALSMDMISQFFEGIMPFVWEVRQEKLQKYTNSVTEKRRSMK